MQKFYFKLVQNLTYFIGNRLLLQTNIQVCYKTYLQLINRIHVIIDYDDMRIFESTTYMLIKLTYFTYNLNIY